MQSKTEPFNVDLAVVGIDIGKDVFHLVGFCSDGKIAFRRKIKRLALAETFNKLAPCIVAMEACLSANLSAERCAVLDMYRGSFLRSTSSPS